MISVANCKAVRFLIGLKDYIKSIKPFNFVLA
jgi:hypothetical protein